MQALRLQLVVSPKSKSSQGLSCLARLQEYESQPSSLSTLLPCSLIGQALLLPRQCYALNPLVLYFNGHPVTSMTPALILIAPLPLNKVEVLEKGANQLDDVGWVWLVEGPRSVIINVF